MAAGYDPKIDYDRRIALLQEGLPHLEEIDSSLTLTTQGGPTLTFTQARSYRDPVMSSGGRFIRGMETQSSEEINNPSVTEYDLDNALARAGLPGRFVRDMDNDLPGPEELGLDRLGDTGRDDDRRDESGKRKRKYKTGKKQQKQKKSRKNKSKTSKKSRKNTRKH